jgi:HPt (histidine-containing phosphotransfer) domain-containing protein
VRALGALLTELEQALTDLDASALKARLHTLRGNAATLGAQRLARALSDQSSPADAQAALDAARPGLATLLQALQASLEPDAPAPEPVVDEALPPTADLALLQMLTLLESADLAALDHLSGLRGRLGRERWRQLDEAVENLDFAGAAELVRDWLQDGTP